MISGVNDMLPPARKCLLDIFWFFAKVLAAPCKSLSQKRFSMLGLQASPEFKGIKTKQEIVDFLLKSSSQP